MRQVAAAACFFTLANAGINTPMRRAIMEITTKSSINVKALVFFIAAFSGVGVGVGFVFDKYIKCFV